MPEIYRNGNKKMIVYGPEDLVYTKNPFSD